MFVPRGVSMIDPLASNAPDAHRTPTWISLDKDAAVDIRKVRVVVGANSAVLENVNVSIRRGRISAVGRDSSADVPEGIEVIDGAGSTLIPGLIDAHVHLTGDIDDHPVARYNNREMRLLRAVADLSLPMRAGFTSLRDCGLGSVATELRAAQKEGLILAPRIATTFRALSETGGPTDWRPLPLETAASDETRGVQADGPWDFVRAVRRNFREGATFTKVFVTRSNLAMPGMWPPREILSEEELRAVVRETHALGAICAAHCTGDEGVSRALDAGVDTVEHGVVSPHSGVLERMAAQGTILVPTLTVFRAAAEAATAPPATADVAKELVDAQFAMVARASELGVRIALGSDTGSGVPFSGMRELALLVEAGLSPVEALEAATSVAAGACGWGDQIGTVEVGKVADLVLVDGKPDVDISVLVDPTRIRAVLQSAEVF